METHVRTALSATVLLLALTLAGCAGSDAATGDPTTATEGAEGPAGPDTAAGAQPADSDAPIPVEGEGDIGDGAGSAPVPATVPDFGVTSETADAVVTPYTSCWTDGAGAGICSDGISSTGDPLAADDQLVVTYHEGELTAMSSEPLPGAGPGVDDPVRSPLPVVQENPGIWLVDVSGLPAGEHVIWLDWTGEPGDSHAALAVSITA
jgi:hypothetical protein